MSDHRNGDKRAATWFRTDRFHQFQSGWYFTTREGTDEGPFELRRHAELRLEEYIRVMKSGWLGKDGELADAGVSLEPVASPR